MKKSVLLVALATIIIAFASCEKEKWENYYGFQKQNLVGSYSNSGVEGAFGSFIESPFCHICDDADIKVDLDEDGIFSIDFLSPRHDFDRSFIGKGVYNDNDFIVEIPSGNYDFMARVKTNESNRIRLVGHARRYYPVFPVGDSVYHEVYVNYVFDVIKN